MASYQQLPESGQGVAVSMSLLVPLKELNQVGMVRVILSLPAPPTPKMLGEKIMALALSSKFTSLNFYQEQHRSSSTTMGPMMLIM